MGFCHGCDRDCWSEGLRERIQLRRRYGETGLRLGWGDEQPGLRLLEEDFRCLVVETGDDDRAEECDSRSTWMTDGCVESCSGDGLKQTRLVVLGGLLEKDQVKCAEVAFGEVVVRVESVGGHLGRCRCCDVRFCDLR